jgi:hypothetical protein
MLEQQMLVLSKSSANKEIFRKELLNSLAWLKTYDLFRLRKWVGEQYGKKYPEVISEAFEPFLYY